MLHIILLILHCTLLVAASQQKIAERKAWVCGWIRGWNITYSLANAYTSSFYYSNTTLRVIAIPSQLPRELNRELNLTSMPLNNCRISYSNRSRIAMRELVVLNELLKVLINFLNSTLPTPKSDMDKINPFRHAII